jgi:outer membrane receptor protein involved in Fe transport
MHTAFDGSSSSSSVEIRRVDGTLARRLTFGPRILHSVVSTDVALFAQDRVQPTPNLLVEFGGRVDRDGITGDLDVTPRVGAVLPLNDTGTALVRGGFGLFYERTPSVAGAFGQFETTTDTRYAADGPTPLGAPETFVHVAGHDLSAA